MDVYKFSFAVLSTANCLLTYLSTKSEKPDIDDPEGEPITENFTANTTKDVKEFQRMFFIVYVFVVAADALQVSAHHLFIHPCQRTHTKR